VHYCAWHLQCWVHPRALCSVSTGAHLRHELTPALCRSSVSMNVLSTPTKVYSSLCITSAAICCYLPPSAAICSSHCSSPLELVFQGPVVQPQKDRQPDWTNTGCNWTAVAGPGSFDLCLVVVQPFWARTKRLVGNWLQPVFLATIWGGLRDGLGVGHSDVVPLFDLPNWVINMICILRMLQSRYYYYYKLDRWIGRLVDWSDSNYVNTIILMGGLVSVIF